MERIVRAIKPEDMKDYMEIYLNAYPAGKDLSDECYEKYLGRNMQSLKEFDHVNFHGLFEDGKLIAQAKFIDFDVNLFGKMSRATGLMALGVHPLHKHKGAARDMVKAFEEYALKSGSNLCMLLPFRIDFYKKMGYGYGTKMNEYHIPTEYLPKDGSIGHVRLIRNDEIEKMLDCFKVFVEKNHGACLKFEEEVRDIYDDTDGRRLGWFDGDDLKGYAVFDFVNVSETNYTLNKMVVRELAYENGEVLKDLLYGIRMQNDLAQTVVIRTGEPDFHNILLSAQDTDGYYIDFGFLKTNVQAIGTMYKIVDIEKFIEDTSYRKFPELDLNAGFAVYDELNNSTSEFTLKFREGKYSFENGIGNVDIVTDMLLSDFSALVMGSCEYAGLYRTGAAKVRECRGETDRAIRTLDTILHVQQKPFTNTDY